MFRGWEERVIKKEMVSKKTAKGSNWGGGGHIYFLRLSANKEIEFPEILGRILEALIYYGLFLDFGNLDL